MSENQENQIELFLEQGKFLVQADKFEKALEIFQKVLGLDEQNLRGYFGLGLCLIALGRILEAEEITKKALTFNPNSSLLYDNLAQIFWLKKDKNAALKCYQKALELEPQRAENHFNYYRINNTLYPKKTPEYIFFLQEAISLKSNNSEYLLALANYYSHYEKKYQKARKIYQEVLQTEPNNAAALNDYGVLLMNSGDKEQAKKMFVLSLKADPTLKQPKTNFLSIINRENKLFWTTNFVCAMFIAIPFLPLYLFIQAIKFKSGNNSRQEVIRVLFLMLGLILTFLVLPKIFFAFKLNYILTFYGACLAIFFLICLPIMKKLDKIQENILDKELKKIKN